MHRTSAAQRLAAAMVLATLLAGALASGVAGAGAVTLQARALVAGRFEAGGWAALAVSLQNDGEPVSGYLAVDSEDGTARRFVELPAGSRKQEMLYLRPQAFARTVSVRFESTAGERLATDEADLRVLERVTGNVAVVGDSTGTLRPQLIARATDLPEPTAMIAADLPERPEPLRGLETIIWSGDSSGVTPAQRRALERWVAAGGQLVVIGGPDWQARTAAFADLLPVGSLRSVDAVSLATLAAWAGADPPPGAESVTASVGDPDGDAIVLTRAGDDVLAAAMSLGAGRISWIGIDLATEPFRAWPGAPSLWARLIPDERIAQQFGGGFMPEEEVGYVLAQALQNLPALEVPPAELLLGVLVAYILLIGPASYVVLGRLDRRELAWVTAPVLVLVFSAGTYAIGASLKGSDVILNEVAVVRTTDGGSAASVSTYAGVYSPTRASYDVVARGDALFSALQNPFDGGATRSGTLLTEQGDPSRLRGLAVGVFGMQAIRAEATIPYQASLGVDWSITESGASGTVTNHGTTAMEDVAIISMDGGLMVGTLSPGQSKDFELTGRQLSGTAASEQVYGSMAINLSSDAQRRAAARRSVIDSLVGYGGLRGALQMPTGGVDRGPFVIGWRVDAPPIAIEIDGHEAQHYSQAVEVISSRPRIGSGQVTIVPSQMVTQVLATVGEASQQEIGFVTVANGEVVFQVSMPLEASGLRPTEVTLIAGNDPGAIYYNQGNVSSLLPAGFRMAVFDHDADAWVDVGDISRASRFVVEDPQAVIDAAGRIQIRIAGTDIAPELGQMPVFAGARVVGVMP